MMSTTYVPQHLHCSSKVIQSLSTKLQKWRNNGSFVVLTGAGLSTESGIPDYRSHGVGLYATSNIRPITYQQFLASQFARKRFWTRNYFAWQRWNGLLPNPSHRILKEWENIGLVHLLITQNVDQLHFKAGSTKVIELHGSNSRVVCINCGRKMTRCLLQRQFNNINNRLQLIEMEKLQETHLRPDGDIDVNEALINDFKIPNCCRCGSEYLKPDVVFFGDQVPNERLQLIKNGFKNSGCLIVIGTSLYIYSGYRVILEAKKQKIPVVIINIGLTRADKECDFKIEGKASEVLLKLDSYLKYGIAK